MFNRWAIEVSGIVVWACISLDNRLLHASSFRHPAKITKSSLDIRSRFR
jgi:hypothetical protein